MPALVLFGRRWLCAGDDLVIPALQLSIFHLVRYHRLSAHGGISIVILTCMPVYIDVDSGIVCVAGRSSQSY